MNKTFFFLVLILPLFDISAQSLVIEYEVTFNQVRTQELIGSDQFKKKVAELQSQPQKHVLTYLDGSSVYQSFPPPIIYDTTSSDSSDVISVHKDSFEIPTIKLFKLKEEPGAYMHKKIKDEESYHYATPIYNEVQKLDKNEIILDYVCKVIEVEMIDKKKAKVWYTDQLSASTGPMGYYNFPGVVLRVETDSMSIRAKNINRNVKNLTLERMNRDLKVYENP